MGGMPSCYQRETTPEEPLTSGCNFEHLPTELRLFIFTFLPYHCLARCEQLNKSSHSIITLNRELMKKHDALKISLYIWLNFEEDDIEVTLLVNSFFATERELEYTATFREKKKCLECKFEQKNEDKEVTTKVSFMKLMSGMKKSAVRTKSISEALRRCFDYLLQRTDIYSIHINSRDDATISRNYGMDAILFSLIAKHKTKVEQWELSHIDIEPEFVEILQNSETKSAGLSYCVYKNNDIPCRIAAYLENLVITTHKEAFDVASFDLLLVKWKNRDSGRLRTFEFDACMGQEHKYCRRVSDIFDCEIRVPIDGELIEVEIFANEGIVFMMEVVVLSGFWKVNFKFWTEQRATFSRI